MEKPLKSMEFCLDVILTKLEANYKNGVITPLNAQDLLMNDFQLTIENHEFFKRMIKKLINDGYAEFKDPHLFPHDDALDFYRKNTMLTVEGFYFITNGGYETEKQRNEANKTQTESDRTLTREVNTSVKRTNALQKWSLVITTVFVVITGITAVQSYSTQLDQYENQKAEELSETQKVLLYKTCRNDLDALSKEILELKKEITTLKNLKTKK